MDCFSVFHRAVYIVIYKYIKSASVYSHLIHKNEKIYFRARDSFDLFSRTSLYRLYIYSSDSLLEFHWISRLARHEQAIRSAVVYSL